MPAVVKIDARNPSLRLLTPFVADRVHLYATEHQPEVSADEFTAGVMGRLWSNDPGQLVVGIVNEDGSLVGHLLAQAQALGSSRWVTILQVRADQNVGDARVQAVEAAVQWAKQIGAQQAVLMTHRDNKEWEKRCGFKHYRHVMRLPLA
jgi:hypothetical protein